MFAPFSWFTVQFLLQLLPNFLSVGWYDIGIHLNGPPDCVMLDLNDSCVNVVEIAPGAQHTPAFSPRDQSISPATLWSELLRCLLGPHEVLPLRRAYQCPSPAGRYPPPGLGSPLPARATLSGFSFSMVCRHKISASVSSPDRGSFKEAEEAVCSEPRVSLCGSVLASYACASGFCASGIKVSEIFDILFLTVVVRVVVILVCLNGQLPGYPTFRYASRGSEPRGLRSEPL